MKETDIIYQRLILNKLDLFDESELVILSNLFNEVSDIQIFNMLTKKSNILNKYAKIISKLTNE